MSDPSTASPAAVVAGGADDVELVAALMAITAVTGTGPVGRHLSGRGPEHRPGARPVDPWTAAGRATGVAAGGAVGAPSRRTHRWARAGSSDGRP